MFHYLSPLNSISIDVYKHILFISINGDLTGTSLDKSVDAYNHACRLLNENYLHWGQIVSIQNEVVLADNVLELLTSDTFDTGNYRRKICATVILPTKQAEKIYETFAAYLPNVPRDSFSTVPEAMSWIDDYLHHSSLDHLSHLLPSAPKE